jgi:predicted porin
VVFASLPGTSRGQVPGTVKLYGFLNAELERVWASGGATPYDPRNRVTDGNSRVGVSGVIKLGEKTNAIWQVEAGLNSFEQSGINDKGLLSAIASRNTFVGVEDLRYGSLRLGYVDSAYRSLVGSGSEIGGNLGLTSYGLDLWNNTSAQMTGNTWSVFSRGEARLKNSVHFLSPEGTVRIGASYGIDESTSTKRGRDRFSVGARVKWEGLQAGLGWDLQRNTGLNTDKLVQGLGAHTDAVDGASTWYLKALAGYQLKSGTYLGVGWERAGYGYAQFVPADPNNPNSSIREGTLTQDALMASVAQSVGDLSVMASVGKLLKLKGAADVFGQESDYEATQYAFGVKYTLNASFATYVYYTAIDNKKQQDANLGQSPLYSNGLGTSDAFLAPGNSPKAFGLGLIARF